jgi:hypothetical protein
MDFIMTIQVDYVNSVKVNVNYVKAIQNVTNVINSIIYIIIHVYLHVLINIIKHNNYL